MTRERRDLPRRYVKSTPKRHGRSSPYRLFTLVALLAGSVVTVALRLRFGVDWLLAYLAGVNVATVVLYAYDKAAAVRGRGLRVPERVLHGVVLAGGTPGALVAQSAFRHKTVKRSFRTWFVAIVAVQVLVVAVWVYFRYVKPV